MPYMAFRSRTKRSAITSTPRIRSLAIMVHLTFHLSTKTPARGLITASGAMYAARIMLTWVGVP